MTPQTRLFVLVLLVGTPLAIGCSGNSTSSTQNGGVQAGGAGAEGGTLAKTGGTTGAANGGSSTPTGTTTGVQFVPSSNSCQNLATQCQGESCCTSITVPAGTFPMGRSTDSTATDYYPSGNSDELPEHSATVSTYALDKYEVTVGRFRQFVEAYDTWHKTDGNPVPGAGQDPNVASTGWGESWTSSSSDLPTDAATLRSKLYCASSLETWTNSTSGADTFPINCVSWYEAFAFCIWDGGRLPTEAEWEYAAAGGTENRLYPWGSAPPDATRANYASANVPVGSTGTSGAAYWGQADMAGSMYEWIFDGYSSSYYGTTESPVVCNNCANTTSLSRSSRGGGVDGYGTDMINRILRVASRATITTPDRRFFSVGLRCARSAP